MKRSDRLRGHIAKVRRHWEWGRSQGFGRLIEEDELNPVTRISNRARRWWWRRTHDVPPGTAMPVYLVGVQRSGTNMIVHGMQRCPEFEVYNENDRRAFESYRLRSLDTIADLVASSRHRYVLFKPLIDSHAVHHLLDDLPTETPGRALWAYRNVDDRVRSSLAKFGDTNLRALQAIVSGSGVDRWEATGLTDEDLALIRDLDPRTMTPASASALFWYLRNSFYFGLGLDRRRDVRLVSYDAFVSDPEGEMKGVCRFLDLRWQPSMIGHVKGRSHQRPRRLPLDGRVRELCDDLQGRLDTARIAQESLAARGVRG